MSRHPYTIYIGPSKETMMQGVIAVVTEVTRVSEDKTVALVTHVSGIMDTSWTVSTLQQAGYNVMVGCQIRNIFCKNVTILFIYQVELLKETDVRPNLARIRASGANIIIVDIDENLIKPFIFQVGISGLF